MGEPIHGKEPMAVNETAGKKAYCTCGLSEKLPYCDGAHKRHDTGLSPVVCEISEAEVGEKWVCQCHRTGTPPWCDGSHSR